MKKYCKDCNKLIKNFYAIRCKSCATTGNLNPNYKNSKLKGENNPNWKGQKSLKRQKYYCKDCGRQICSKTALYGLKRCQSCRQKGVLNHKYGIKENLNIKNKRIAKIISQNKIFPNKSELKLLEILRSLKTKYLYVGNGRTIIEGFNPDFINEKEKKIIELYGNYWHTLPGYKERDVRRLKTYKKYGYKVLVIWEKELKNLQKLKQKILKFTSKE